MWAVVLEPGRDRSVQRRHPWLLSGAVARVVDASEAGEVASPGRETEAGIAVDGDDLAGAWVAVRAAAGPVIGYGHYSPRSTIRVRMMWFGADDPGEALLAERIERAVQARAQSPLFEGVDALRLVNAEGDGLPGLVVDRYADVVVARASTAGMQRRMPVIAEILRKTTGASAGYERGDGHAARREGYAMREGPLFGDVPGSVEITEHGRRYTVDVVHGQKTGFYLDQRDARGLVEKLAAGRRVLDVFSYTGGFAVAAARGGARSLTLLDSSAPALERAEQHLRAAGATCPYALRAGDAFAGLREAAAAGECFELIVVDPPPLARRRNDVDAALRAYRDLLRQAVACAAPDASLVVFSCSHHIAGDRLERVVAGVAAETARAIAVETRLGAPADHPVSVHHPEGRYLEGLLLRVSGREAPP